MYGYACSTVTLAAGVAVFECVCWRVGAANRLSSCQAIQFNLVSHAFVCQLMDTSSTEAPLAYVMTALISICVWVSLCVCVCV